MTRLVSLASLLLAAALATPSLARAQEEQPAAARATPDTLLKLAYSLRRKGEFGAASAIFDQLLRQLDRKDARRGDVVREAAELHAAAGKPVRALLTYRRNHHVTSEVDLLLEMGASDRKRWEEALTVARLVHYARGEILALARLGRHEEALQRLETYGGRFVRLKAEVLAAQGRHREAAAVYASLEDFFTQAQELQAAGNPTAARRAFQDAVVQLEFSVKHESKPAVVRCRRQLEQAPDGITRERARLALAEAYGGFALDYRRLAQCYVLAGKDRQAAAAFARNAARFYRQQQQMLEDERGGGDAFGRERVKALGLPGTIAETEAEAERYGTAR